MNKKLKIFSPLLFLLSAAPIWGSQTINPFVEKTETRIQKAKKIIATIGRKTSVGVRHALSYRKTCFSVAILSMIFLPVIVFRAFGNKHNKHVYKK